MMHKIKSIRPFIGSENFEISRSFYRDLGFEESVLAPNMSYFNNDTFGFYLQDAYVQDWVDNTMIFLEVDNVSAYWNRLTALNLPAKYEGVQVKPIV